MACSSLSSIPVRNRILKHRSARVSKPQQLSHDMLPCRPDCYKTWTETRMDHALKAVADGKSIRQAAEEHGVPRSTLHDRVTGKVVPGTKSGPRKHLTSLEEEEFVEFLKHCSAIGYGKTRKQAVSLVQEALDKKGTSTQVTLSWLKSFSRRHPDLTLRVGESVSHARAMGASPENLGRYFDLLEETLVSNGLMDEPCCLYNADETGLCLDANPIKVIGPKGHKHFYSVTSGKKTQVTVLSAVNAAGQYVPPLIISNRKNLPSMSSVEVPGSVYAYSRSGWIDGDLFENWFIEHFLHYVPPKRPLLLLIDGHSSHFGPRFINTAAQEKVLVFCLPPNTTHRTQPLDRGPFSPLKRYWREECQLYLSTNPGKVVSYYNFTALFEKAWKKAMTPANIMAGFKVAGVYPFDRDAVICKPAHKVPLSLSEQTGLRFIPMYSPMPQSRSRSQHQSPLSSPPHMQPLLSSSASSEVENEPTTARTVEEVYFTQDEIQLYTRRFKEGYNLVTDKRYTQWLKVHKGHDAPRVTTTKPSTALTSVLKVPVVKYPETSKASGRLITTKEFRQQIMEKERKKQEVEEQKILKKAEREKKRQEEADRKVLRKAERERKKMEKDMELKMKNQKKVSM